MTTLTTFFLTILSALLFASSADAPHITCQPAVLAANGDVSVRVQADIPAAIEIDTVQLIVDYDETVFATATADTADDFDFPGFNQTFSHETQGDMLAFSAGRSSDKPAAQAMTTTVATIILTPHDGVCLDPDDTLLTFQNDGTGSGTIASLLGARIPVDTEACVLGSADIFPTCDNPEAIALTYERAVTQTTTPFMLASALIISTLLLFYAQEKW